MLTVEGLELVEGEEYTEGDVGDWTSLLSQAIGTAGSAYSNRLAAKTAQRLGAGGINPNVQLAWQSTPGVVAPTIPNSKVLTPASGGGGAMWPILAVAGVAALFLFRKR